MSAGRQFISVPKRNKRESKPLLLVLAAFILAGLSSCASWMGPEESEGPREVPSTVSELPKKPAYKHGNRATRDDFIDESQAAGSLWASSGQTNYFFTKNQIRSPGDIVTLIVEEELYKKIGEQIKNVLIPQEQEAEVALLRNEEKLRLLGMNKPALAQKDGLSTSSASPTKPGQDARVTQSKAGDKGQTDSNSLENLAESKNESLQPITVEDAEREAAKLDMNNVDIYRSLELSSGDKFMGEIIHRYPNGNYQIRVSHKVSYKRGNPKQVSIVAVVKAAHVAEDTDLIESSKLYETQIDVQ